MGRHTKEYNEGYQAAIEAIKKALSGSSGTGSSSSGQEDQNLDSDMIPPSGQGGGDSNGSNKGQNDNKSGQNQSGGGGSRTSKGDESQGVVRPEDCMGNSGLDNCPSTPGGMISKDDGDKIANQEGYDKEGGNDSSIAKDWKDTAIKATQRTKLEPGSAAGKFMARLEGLYKAQIDWKKELKKIIGTAINSEDKRSALVNKNVLVSQSRFTRTDKDKFDSLDYMMVWVDSSYSMSDEELKACLTEIYAVALAKKPLKLVVVQCDTKIQEIKEFTSLKDLKSYAMHATVKGRGGTDLKPCWDLLKNDSRYNRRKPDIVVIFTDGGLTQHKRDLRTMKTLCWCIINNPAFNVQYKDPNTKCLHIKK
jgi:hypothetical protein